MRLLLLLLGTLLVPTGCSTLGMLGLLIENAPSNLVLEFQGEPGQAAFVVDSWVPEDDQKKRIASDAEEYAWHYDAVVKNNDYHVVTIPSRTTLSKHNKSRIFIKLDTTGLTVPYQLKITWRGSTKLFTVTKNTTRGFLLIDLRA